MEIHVPQLLFPRFVEAQDPVKASFGIYGEYHVIKRRGGVIIQELKFRNIITDQALAWLASERGNIIDRCRYLYLGTGTATPVTTDTTLQARGFGGRDRTEYLTEQGTVPDYWLQLRWELGLADAVGTWTEVGCGRDQISPYRVFSRQLFKDDLGNPIAVEKTGNDTLTIIYKIHVVRPSDVPFSSVINLAGVGDVTVESLMLNNGLKRMTGHYIMGTTGVTNYSHLGANNDPLTPDRPVGTYLAMRAPYTDSGQQATLLNYVPHVAGSNYRDLVVEWGTAVVGNVGEAGICIIESNSYTTFMSRFVPLIPKDGTKKLRLGYRVTFNRI